MGTPLTPPDWPLHGKFVTRQALACNTPVELAYYSDNLRSPKDVCAHCGEGDGVVDVQLKRYITVLPICGHCRETGMNPIVRRPYGKSK